MQGGVRLGEMASGGWDRWEKKDGEEIIFSLEGLEAFEEGWIEVNVTRLAAEAHGANGLQILTFLDKSISCGILLFLDGGSNN